MVDNIYPFNTQEEAEKHQEALRESLQDTKKLCIEAEPRPSASIHIEEESEENQREQKRQQKCQNCRTGSSLHGSMSRSGLGCPLGVQWVKSRNPWMNAEPAVSKSSRGWREPPDSSGWLPILVERRWTQILMKTQKLALVRQVSVSIDGVPTHDTLL